MTAIGRRLLALPMAALMMGGAGLGGARASETLQAVVVVQPQPSGPPGAELEVVGLGFDPGQSVELRWNGVQGRQIGAAGGPDFFTNVTVPNADPGLYTLVALSRDANGVLGSAASTNVLVTEPGKGPAPGPAALPAASRADAPPSPASTAPIVWVVVAVALVGLLGVAAWGRRRRTRREAPGEPQPG